MANRALSKPHVQAIVAPFIHRSGRAGFKCRLRARELKARARGGGSEHLVRTILYLQGWLIGARARRRERDAAMRPRDLRGEISGRILHVTLAARGDVRSSLTHRISRGVLSTLWGPTPRT